MEEAQALSAFANIGCLAQPSVARLKVNAIRDKLFPWSQRPADRDNGFPGIFPVIALLG
jgi:hypothetical protein